MARVFRSIAFGVLLAAVVTFRGDAQTQGGQAAQPTPTTQGGQTVPAAPGAPPDSPTDPVVQSPTPVFRGGIDFVRVDVIVTDKAGNPVGDLKATKWTSIIATQRPSHSTSAQAEPP